MKKLFGVTTAMTTLFTADGAPDVQAMRELTDFLIEKGVNCLYPLGTTGEMLRMTVEERKLVAKTVVEQAAGPVSYTHLNSPFRMLPPETPIIMDRSKKDNANISGGPKLSAKRATGNDATIRTIVPTSPPKHEKIVLILSALAIFPCLTRTYPSKVCAMDAGVPGVLIRIAEIPPAQMAEL